MYSAGDNFILVFFLSLSLGQLSSRKNSIAVYFWHEKINSYVKFELPHLNLPRLMMAANWKYEIKFFDVTAWEKTIKRIVRLAKNTCFPVTIKIWNLINGQLPAEQWEQTKCNCIQLGMNWFCKYSIVGRWPQIITHFVILLSGVIAGLTIWNRGTKKSAALHRPTFTM